MRIGLVVNCLNNLNIDEFMEHYFSLGFNHIILLNYEKEINNNFSKNKYDILRIDDIFNIDIFKNELLPIIKEKMDFCLFCNINEYLYIRFNKTINQLIKRYIPLEQLKVSILNFNIDFNKAYYFSKNNFTLSDNKLSKYTKTITKVSKIDYLESTGYFKLLKSSDENIIKNSLNEKSIDNIIDLKMLNYELEDLIVYMACLDEMIILNETIENNSLLNVGNKVLLKKYKKN